MTVSPKTLQFRLQSQLSATILSKLQIICQTEFSKPTLSWESLPKLIIFWVSKPTFSGQSLLKPMNCFPGALKSRYMIEWAVGAAHRCRGAHRWRPHSDNGQVVALNNMLATREAALAANLIRNYRTRKIHHFPYAAMVMAKSARHNAFHSHCSILSLYTLQLRLSAKSWFGKLQHQVLAQAVSKKLALKAEVLGRGWQCQLKVGFESWTSSFQLSPQATNWFGDLKL